MGFLSRLLLSLWLFGCACPGARADIILLLSDDKTSVTDIAKAIQANSKEKIDVFNLGGDQRREDEIVPAIVEAKPRQVVAIGLLAAQVARKRLPSKQVVFCQVLNFEESDLVAPWIKGVSSIPSLHRQFSAWKMLDPSLHRVGLIVGGHAQYIVDDADAAARRLGLELEVIKVQSDRAVMFGARELMGKKIQGLWLAPDSSILNKRVILELMSFSIKNNIQVLGFSPMLLKEGALLSATPDSNEIAQLVLERLKKSATSPAQSAQSAQSSIAGEALTPLGSAKITVSNAAALRFGLVVTPKLREQADVQ